MSIESRNIVVLPSVEPEGFTTLLESYNFRYTEGRNYILCGEPELEQGWILHVSSVISQVELLITTLLPILASENVAFRVIKNKGIASKVLNGALAYGRIGKMMTLYPRSNEHAVQLAKVIIAVTTNINGPTIPTDVHIGGIVYTRHGMFPTKANVGQNMLQEFAIPAQLPSGINWPFGEVADFKIKPQKLILEGQYRIQQVIKPDARGRVMLGLYSRNIVIVRKCIIKEGKYKMWSDDAGRDVQDRLKWQLQLHKKLAGIVPIPKIIDSFTTDGDMYIVMEFIEGTSARELIERVTGSQSWISLSLDKRRELITVFQKIIDIIDKLHINGIVYRDISPENFIINDKGVVYLIDLEISYDLHLGYPFPPFTIGTLGFISPEQYQVATPTIKEDIYGLGALMIAFVTGLTPNKFQKDDPQKLLTGLISLTGDKLLSQLIVKCVSNNPAERPMINEIRKTLHDHLINMVETVSANIQTNISQATKEEITEVIAAAINGLSDPSLMTEEHLWLSPRAYTDPFVGNPQLERVVQYGLHNGIAGIMLLLARVHKAGFDISSCRLPYEKCLERLRKLSPIIASKMHGGLYYGASGILTALQEGVQNGMIDNHKDVQEIMNACLYNNIQGLDYSGGVAGKGITLLKYGIEIDAVYSSKEIENYVDLILGSQKRTGEWELYQDTAPQEGIITGLSMGVAGVILFLLHHYERSKDEKVISAAGKGLEWLNKMATTSKGKTAWSIAGKVKIVDPCSIDVGIPGIAWVFAKAYQVTHNYSYKAKSESALMALSERPVYADYTYSYGLAGLGEIYFAASKIFGNEELQKRGNWIANTFSKTILKNTPNTGYWAMSIDDGYTPDLMTGVSGIIHFLMKTTLHENPNILI